MRFSNNVTVTWTNGWSLEIEGGGFLARFSIMGPRQVFYSLVWDKNPKAVIVQAEADQVWNCADDARLLAVMEAMKDLPSKPVFNACGMVVNQTVPHEWFPMDDQDVRHAMLSGRQVEVPKIEPLVLDDSDNRFNSMQS
jgi:hypothetical protein